MTVYIKANPVMFISTANSGNVVLDEKVQSQGHYFENTPYINNLSATQSISGTWKTIQSSRALMFKIFFT